MHPRGRALAGSASFLRLFTPFLDRLFRRFQIGRLGLRLLLTRCRCRVMAERYEERKVIRPNILHDGNLEQPERFLEKHMVERPPQQRPFGIERVVGPASDARVQQSAHLLKQAVGSRPCNVVQITGHDRRGSLFPDFLADDEQFRVPLLRILQGRRLGMQAVEIDARTRRKAEASS